MTRNTVWMPFSNGLFAVIANDGRIIKENLTKNEAKALVGSIEREALSEPRIAGDDENHRQAL